MADISVETIGDSPEDIEKRLEALNRQTRVHVNEALNEVADQIQDEIEETAPVDTGAYKSSWYRFNAAEDEVWILSNSNEAPHNQFVMLPNSNFQGNSQADVPSLGILHNVEGIAKKHTGNVKTSLSDEIAALIRSLSK